MRYVSTRLGMISCFLFCFLGQASANPRFQWEVGESGFSLWLKGQYLPRLTLFQQRDMRDFDPQRNNGKDIVQIQHRARLGVGLAYKKHLRFFFEVQDVRAWGSETDPLGDLSADGFDLSQGWGQVFFTPELSLKLGRMIFALDSQRIFGAAGWALQGRRFNGVLLNLAKKLYSFKAFYSTFMEKGWLTDDSHLAVLWFRWNGSKFFRPSVMYTLDYRGNQSLLRHTMGVYAKGGVRGFRYEAEFYYQLGNLNETTSIQAYLASVAVQYTIEHKTKPTLRVWADILSGDDDTTDKVSKVFDTLFASNHKFYAFTDFFLAIPRDTAGRGLMDFGVRFRIQPTNQLLLFIDYHYLRLAQEGTSVSGEKGQELGQEIDFVAKYSFWKGMFSVLLKYGVFLPMSGSSVLGKGADLEHFLAFQTRSCLQTITKRNKRQSTKMTSRFLQSFHNV